MSQAKKNRPSASALPRQHGEPAEFEAPLPDSSKELLGDGLAADAWEWDELDDEPLPEHGDFWIEADESEI